MVGSGAWIGLVFGCFQLFSIFQLICGDPSPSGSIMGNDDLSSPFSADLISAVTSAMNRHDAVNGHAAPLNVRDGHGARILLFPPILFESHVFIFKTLAKGVQKYGHHVTLYVSDRRVLEEDSPDFSVRRFPGIFSTEEARAFLQAKVSSILAGKPTFLELFDILAHYSKNCDIIFSEGRESIEQLRRDKYDLMIVDPNEMCGFLLAKELGIPHVVFSTGMWVPYESYSPSPPSYVPEFNSLLSDRMNFMQRFYNTILYGISRFGTSYLIFPMYNRLINKYHIGYKDGKPTDYLADLIAKSQAWLLSTDLALEFPRPIMPNTEFVGGITAHPARVLPQELQSLADQSAETGGFIIVSFGTGVKRLTAKLEAMFASVLSQQPYLVFWRYPAILQGLGPNVKLIDWLPQADLIAHPNLRVFIGHGGTNGVYECIYHGVPIIGMPLFGDHYDSMIRVQTKGAGVLLDWKRLTAEKLKSAIQDVIEKPEYRQAAQFLSRVYHDQPLTALERASRRIDYTIRYRGAEHLRPAVLDLNLFQYFLMDVQLAFILLTLALVWFLHVFVTVLTAYFGGRWGDKSDYTFLGRHPSFASRWRHVLPDALACPSWVVAVPKNLARLVMKAGALLVLSICSGLRFLAVRVTFHCGKCSRSSRAFLRCLNFVSRTVGQKFPNSIGKSYDDRPLDFDLVSIHSHDTGVATVKAAGDLGLNSQHPCSSSSSSPPPPPPPPAAPHHHRHHHHHHQYPATTTTPTVDRHFFTPTPCHTTTSTTALSVLSSSVAVPASPVQPASTNDANVCSPSKLYYSSDVSSPFREDSCNSSNGSTTATTLTHSHNASPAVAALTLPGTRYGRVSDALLEPSALRLSLQTARWDGSNNSTVPPDTSSSPQCLAGGGEGSSSCPSWTLRPSFGAVVQLQDDVTVSPSVLRNVATARNKDAVW